MCRVSIVHAKLKEAGDPSQGHLCWNLQWENYWSSIWGLKIAECERRPQNWGFSGEYHRGSRLPLLGGDLGVLKGNEE